MVYWSVENWIDGAKMKKLGHSSNPLLHHSYWINFDIRFQLNI